MSLACTQSKRSTHVYGAVPPATVRVMAPLETTKRLLAEKQTPLAIETSVTEPDTVKACGEPMGEPSGEPGEPIGEPMGEPWGEPGEPIGESMGEPIGESI